MTIRDLGGLRMAYDMLAFYKERVQEIEEAERRDYIEERIKEMKRTIRAFVNKPIDEERRIVKDNGIDGFIVLFPLPDTIKSMEAADEWFMWQEYMECRPSMYDCTGQWFTSWYKIFERNGRFWAYHSVVDV